MTEWRGEISAWLARLRDGDGEALDRLVPMLYDELRARASRLMDGEREGHTLTPPPSPSTRQPSGTMPVIMFRLFLRVH